MNTLNDGFETAKRMCADFFLTVLKEVWFADGSNNFTFPLDSNQLSSANFVLFVWVDTCIVRRTERRLSLPDLFVTVCICINSKSSISFMNRLRGKAQPSSMFWRY